MMPPLYRLLFPTFARLAPLFALIVVLTAGCAVGRAADALFPAPTRTPEPLLPTPTATNSVPSVVEEAEPTATTTAPATAIVTRSTNVPATVQAPAGSEMDDWMSSDLARFGVGIARGFDDIENAVADGLVVGAALDWNVHETTPAVPVQFWQMIRIGEGGIRKVTWPELADAVAANPGAYWLVGNEPDVQWQDNVTPQRYAVIYHDVYSFIKERDPMAKLVIGGVSQPTPLRRAYLDIVLETYQETYGEPLPVDVWNVHAFILREEADSWGVDIPPGMEGEQGILYEIDDHDNLQIFAQNIRDFRRWMVERGYDDTPLVISEYGILMPPDYGFPAEDVAAFMIATFDFFRAAAGDDGFTPDGGRLVQWWFWYSLYDGELYPTGNLWDPEERRLTDLGLAWSDYISSIPPLP